MNWLTKVALVLLRVSVGWHFLYAGIDKLSQSDFTSNGFLAQSKGPFADHFYALIPDIDGRERLDPTPVDESKPDSLPKGVTRAHLALDAYQDKFVQYFALSEAQTTKAHEASKAAKDRVVEYFNDHSDELQEYFHELGRLDKNKQAPDTPYQRKRNWDEQQRLRGKVKSWQTALDGLANRHRSDLIAVLTTEQRKSKGESIPLSWKEKLSTDRLVMYSNVAIGVCLIVGLFTRLAALGGVLFLAQIVAAQPDLPGLYPPPHPSAGRSMIVNKEFIEMMALFVLATTRVGRWGGLDALIHHVLFRRDLPKDLP